MAKTTTEFIKDTKDYKAKDLPEAISKNLKKQFVESFNEGCVIVLEDNGDFKNYIKVFDTLMKPKISAFAKLNDRKGVLVFSQAFKGDISKEHERLFVSCLGEGTPQFEWAQRKRFYMFPVVERFTLKDHGLFFQLSISMIPLPL